VGDNPITLTESDVNLPRLGDALKKIRIFEETLHPGEPFLGRVNIQADQKTPLVYIKRVMQTCILEGFPNINFVTRQPDDEKPKTE
jgi:biopolymer transport protein ExbD